MCIAILKIHKPTLKPFITQEKAGQLLTKRLVQLFAKRIKSQIETRFRAEELLDRERSALFPRIHDANFYLAQFGRQRSRIWS
jgi:hypothetical protein